MVEGTGGSRGRCDQVAPSLAGDGGAPEAHGVEQQDTEEDLLHELVRQQRTHEGSRGRSKGFISCGLAQPGAWSCSVLQDGATPFQLFSSNKIGEVSMLVIFASMVRISDQK